MKVKKLVNIAGMIGSFALVIGIVCRFHTRGMISQIANVAERYGWNGSLRMDDRVLVCLMFWKRNSRELNSWEMRSSKEVGITSVGW